VYQTTSEFAVTVIGHAPAGMQFGGLVRASKEASEERRWI
jgi:hypothetical protein